MAPNNVIETNKAPNKVSVKCDLCNEANKRLCSGCNDFIVRDRSLRFRIRVRIKVVGLG